MRILILLCLSLSLLAAQASAQTLDDALRFSEVSPFGTARSLGTGNSMAAIGADWTAVQANPAGLGMYRFNDFTVTLGSVLSGTTDARLDGGPAAGSSSDARFTLPQLALVFTREPIGSRWRQLNFGVGVSQTNRFEETINYRGRSPGSVSDLWLDQANIFALNSSGFREISDQDFFPVLSPDVLTSNELSNFGSGLALDAGAIRSGDGSASPEFYSSDYDDFGRTGEFITVNGEEFATRSLGVPLDKTGSISRRGYLAGVDFSFAGNFEEKLIVGGTLGLVNSSFTETNLYTETDALDSVPAFDRLSYRQNTVTDGTGFVMRAGIIYVVDKALRIGLAYHSPTFVSATENYTVSVEYTSTQPGGIPEQSIQQSPEASVLEYRYRTPSQYRFSVASVIGRRGFVGAEFNYINFPGGKFSIDDEFDPTDFEGELNEGVDREFQSSFQARLGGEVNFNPLRLRLGAEYIGSPFTPAEGFEEDPSYGFSAGLGYRKDRFAVDAGYRISIRPDRTYRPYTFVEGLPFDFPQPQVDFTPTQSNIVVTVGWKLTPRISNG